MFLLTDILTFLVQLLKGSLIFPEVDRELWTKCVEVQVGDVSALSHQCLLALLQCCLWTFPAHCQRYTLCICGWLCTALVPCAVLQGNTSACTPQPPPFTFFPMQAHAHIHSAFPRHPSAVLRAFWARPQKCNTWHTSLCWLCNSQCTGVQAIIMFLTSILLLHPFQTKIVISCCFS